MTLQTTAPLEPTTQRIELVRAWLQGVVPGLIYLSDRQ